MAKDNREIVHGISKLAEGSAKGLPSMIVFSKGMEDELAAAFTDKELKVMQKRGDITGNWKSTKK